MAIGSYASLSHVKQRIGISGTTDDALIQRLCDEVNTWIETVCGRPIAPDPTTVYTADGWDASEDGRVLYFPRGIRSLSQLEVAPHTGAAYVVVPATDYFLRPTPNDRPPGWPAFEVHMTNIPSAGNLYPRFFRGYDTIRLTGLFGWDAIPADLVLVAEQLAVNLYRERAAGGTDSVTIGEDGTRTISRLLSTRDWQTISRYRIKTASFV
jgi:hypothetical protein